MTIMRTGEDDLFLSGTSEANSSRIAYVKYFVLGPLSDSRLVRKNNIRNRNMYLKLCSLQIRWKKVTTNVNQTHIVYNQMSKIKYMFHLNKNVIYDTFNFTP